MNATSGTSAATATPAAAQPAPRRPGARRPRGRIPRRRRAQDPRRHDQHASPSSRPGPRSTPTTTRSAAASRRSNATSPKCSAQRPPSSCPPEPSPTTSPSAATAAPGPRAIVQEQSHLYHDSGDTVTRLSSINLVPLAPGRPHFTAEELEETLSASVSGSVINEVGAVMIESPVRQAERPGRAHRRDAADYPDVPRARHTDPPGRRAPVHDVGRHRHTRRRLRRHVRHHLRVPVQVLRRLPSARYCAAAPPSSTASTTSAVSSAAACPRRTSPPRSPSRARQGFRAAFRRRHGQGGPALRATQHAARHQRRDATRTAPTSSPSTSTTASTPTWPPISSPSAAYSSHPREGSQDSFALTVNTTILRQSNDELVDAFSAALR